MEVFKDVVGLLIAIGIMNLLAVILESPCRFGWYNKKDEERGRILRKTYESRK